MVCLYSLSNRGIMVSFLFSPAAREVHSCDCIYLCYCSY
nr:MAG TPA: hypothetical protein [Caudoviricetes sp.]